MARESSAASSKQMTIDPSSVQRVRGVVIVPAHCFDRLCEARVLRKRAGPRKLGLEAFDTLERRHDPIETLAHVLRQCIDFRFIDQREHRVRVHEFDPNAASLVLANHDIARQQ